MGWPLLLKQLRVDLRRNRFPYIFSGCLLLLAAAEFLTIALSSSDRDVTATQIGIDIYNWFFLLQFLVVLIVFPAFSATAFTEERVTHSLDLLLVTSLSPIEIVLGKFLATSGYCLLSVLATVPLLAVSFLFGGVTVWNVVEAYVILVALTLLVSMFALFVSSRVPTTFRSLLTVYSLTVVVLVASKYLLLDRAAEVADENPGQTILAALWQAVGEGRGRLVLITWAVHLLAAFFLLLLGAANSIRPRAADRSSAIRLVTFVYVPAAVLTSAVWIPGSVPVDVRIEGAIARAALLLFVVAIVFTAEDCRVSARVRERIAKLRGVLVVARILKPGPMRGFLFSSVLSVIVCGLLFLLLHGPAQASGDPKSALVLRESAMVVPLFTMAVGSLGVLLSYLSYPPLYAGMTSTFTSIIALLLPSIVFINHSNGVIARLGYAFSPIVLWQLVTEEQIPAYDAVGRDVGGVPIVDIAKILYGGVTVTCLVLAWFAARASRHAEEAGRR